jgi:cell division septation protein DedD
VRDSYYVIELSARWLTVLLVALAVVMVLAFALGYGAARSVASGGGAEVGMAALQAPAPTEIPEVVIPTPLPSPPVEPTTGPEPTAAPTELPIPAPTLPPAPRPTATAVVTDFFVQVLASSREATVEDARAKLVGLGFPRDNQQVITVREAGSPTLFKLRLGPFPNRVSADRVAQRMSAAGFPDAWVVTP